MSYCASSSAGGWKTDVRAPEGRLGKNCTAATLGPSKAHTYTRTLQILAIYIQNK